MHTKLAFIFQNVSFFFFFNDLCLLYSSFFFSFNFHLPSLLLYKPPLECEMFSVLYPTVISTYIHACALCPALKALQPRHPPANYFVEERQNNNRTLQSSLPTFVRLKLKKREKNGRPPASPTHKTIYQRHFFFRAFLLPLFCFSFYCGPDVLRPPCPSRDCPAG